jgi:hypothetical protein
LKILNKLTSQKCIDVDSLLGLIYRVVVSDVVEDSECTIVPPSSGLKAACPAETSAPNNKPLRKPQISNKPKSKIGVLRFNHYLSLEKSKQNNALIFSCYMNQTTGVRFPAEAIDFSLLHSVKSGSGAHPSC